VPTPSQRRIRRSRTPGADHIAAKIPKVLIGMIFEVAVAKKATAVVKDVLKIASRARAYAYATRRSSHEPRASPSRPSTQPPTEPGSPTRPPTDNDSDGALGLTTTLTAAAVAVAAAF
jgi:hypothetical protein